MFHWLFQYVVFIFYFYTRAHLRIFLRIYIIPHDIPRVRILEIERCSYTKQWSGPHALRFFNFLNGFQSTHTQHFTFAVWSRYNALGFAYISTSLPSFNHKYPVM